MPIKYKVDSFNPQPLVSKKLHYLMNDIRPIVSGIAILLPQIISVIIWVQDLHSLHKMVKEIVKLLSMYDNQLFKKKALSKMQSMYVNHWSGKKSSRYHGSMFSSFFVSFKWIRSCGSIQNQEIREVWISFLHDWSKQSITQSLKLCSEVDG